MTEAAFYPWLLGTWAALGAVTLATLFFVTAPYGRHARQGWGPSLPAAVGWIAMELPAPLVFFAIWTVGRWRGLPGSVALLLLWESHYVYRAFVFPWLRRGAARPVPLGIVFSAAFFNVVNGYLNARWLFHLGPGRDAGWLGDPRFLLGAALFAVGFAVHVNADSTLRNLRAPGETSYRVPHGGLFRWVSCPNYLGEIVEWIGWAIASGSLAGASFAFWTVGNLLPRARSHHRWYRSTFPDYPRERKAILPLVF